MEDRQRPRWEHFQRVWRVVAIVVPFAVLIPLSILAAGAAVTSRTPRLAGASAVLLWIWAAIMLALFPGMPAGP